jgi:hypothetical protein
MLTPPYHRARARHLLLGAALAVLFAAGMAGAQAAHASVYYFCPHSGTDQYFPSGDTCTAVLADAYHHLDEVYADEYNPTNHRKCANWRHSPSGDVVGAWKCNTAPYDNYVVKYPGGDAGYGTIHNGDPDGFRMFGIEGF